jgi:hypothetical protein
VKTYYKVVHGNFAAASTFWPRENHRDLYILSEALKDINLDDTFFNSIAMD